MAQKNVSEYRLVHDYSDQPLEIFDGFEPDHLFLSPQWLGLQEDCLSVDLIAEISKKYRRDQVGERYRQLYERIPSVVLASDKSSNKRERVSAYLAVIPQTNVCAGRLILFSFFEVSPLRYHCFIHKVYDEVNSSD